MREIKASETFNSFVIAGTALMSPAELFGEMQSAIEQNDGDMIRSYWQTFTGLFFYKEEIYDLLLRRAVEGDHDDAFKALLEYSDNPNYAFVDVCGGYDVGVDEPYLVKTIPLLYSALLHESPKVALSLAWDHRTDIEQAMQESMAVNGEQREMSIYETPLRFARRIEGMEDVVSVLSRRTKEMKQNHAPGFVRRAFSLVNTGRHSVMALPARGRALVSKGFDDLISHTPSFGRRKDSSAKDRTSLAAAVGR